MNIEALAREAGMERDDAVWFSPGRDDIDVTHEHIARFASLVRAAALEEAAQDREDAARYRVLRDDTSEHTAQLNVWDWRGCKYEELGCRATGEELDEALDAIRTLITQG